MTLSGTSPLASPAESAWSPFRYPSFAVLWTATLISNVGGWMHDVGAGWLMTTLTTSPVMVSLVQTATALPVFLLALPGGALADIVDRRRLLMVSMLVMTLVAAGLGLTVLAGTITPASLLVFTFGLGMCTALVNPAWQAIVPSLVPRSELASAVALNSVGINVSRAIGPALGGAVIVYLGLEWPFLINAISFLIVIAALIWWRAPAASPNRLPAEHIPAAIRSGLRYARSSAALKQTLIRSLMFIVFASAYWALLPLIARERLAGGAELYGLLVGSIGVGAVTGAIFLPRLRRRLGPGRLVVISTAATALVLATYALAGSPYLAAAASFVAGASWLAALSSFNISTQMSLPDWVRARGLAIFGTAFFGAMAAGSLLWGQLAGRVGLTTTLLVAAGGALVFTWPATRFSLQSAGALNLAPSSHWPQPVVVTGAAADQGPVLVTVEYQVNPEQSAEFLGAMAELGSARRRDGAYNWGVYQDVTTPSRYVECFFAGSWLDHLRHHERVTEDDRKLQARIGALHSGSAAPLVRHCLATGRQE